jgi:hypothetical protein
MATLTKGKTFTSGETVTPSKLHELVDQGTVTGIVNADIDANAAIAGTKIAPNFGSQNVVTSGSIATGTASPSAQFQITKAETTAYNGAATDGQLGAGATALVQQTAGTNTGLAQLVFQSRGSQPFNRIACSGGSAPFMAFATNNAERVRITSAGNVGIANTSPTEKLHVIGNIKASGFIDADTCFRGQSSDSASAPSFTWTGDTNTGMFRPATNNIGFSTNGSEAFRINASGALNFGTTTAITPGSTTNAGMTYSTSSARLQMSCSGDAPLSLQRTASNGSIQIFYRNTAVVGTISVTTTATAYNTSSDYRLKENPTPLIGGLATIDQLQPCEFTWRSDGSTGRGFIAHELQAVVPEAVTGEKDAVDADGNPEYQGVDAAKLVPYLVSAVQELKTRVEALEAA